MTIKQDGAWHDSMYNNRALVPDHPVYLRRWTEESAQVQRSHPRTLDVRYGGGPNEHLDIFPTADANAPVLFWIHGGWWRTLDKRDHSFVAPAFTSEGACVVIPNYALAPAVTIPQVVMQMVSALAWTWRNVARHGGDPSRITVAGHSAGGHLAAMMLACVWPAYAKDLPANLVRNAMSVSGVNDLGPVMRAPFLQESLRLDAQQVRKASPALLPAPAQGKLYSVAGGDESAEFIRQNALIQKAWGKTTVPVCEALPGLNHFSILQALVEPGHRLNTLALDLLRS